MVIAPNPIHQTGRIILDDNNPSTSKVLELTSANGVFVKQYILTLPNFTFDVSGLPAGIYVYKLSDTNKTTNEYRGKLIVY